MNRRDYLKTSLAIGGRLTMPTGVLALVGCGRVSNAPELAGFDGKIMGTGYSVRLGSTDRSVAAQPIAPVTALAKKVHRELQNVDSHMSTWRPESELSLFNASTHSEWQVMTPATTSVIKHALNISQLSAGAFDVTVGPLVDLWGFGPGAMHSAEQLSKKPAASDIRKTLARVGYDGIEINLDANAVRKHNPNVQIDLSGIAKGHAVDRIASLLDSEGIENYLVEVGGELRSRGRKPDGSLWRVAIEQPSVGQRDAFRVIELDDQAIATSGNYRNFFTDGTKQYSHAIDPRTGESVRHELASVSVMADTTMAADALSTAMMIMGPEAAMEFADQHKIAAHMILKMDSGLRETVSETFVARNG